MCRCLLTYRLTSPGLVGAPGWPAGGGLCGVSAGRSACGQGGSWSESVVRTATGRAFCRTVSFLPAETQPAKPALVIRYNESPEQRLAPRSTFSLCSGGTCRRHRHCPSVAEARRLSVCPYVLVLLDTFDADWGVRRSVWGKPGPWAQNGVVQSAPPLFSCALVAGAASPPHGIMPSPWG